METDITVRCLSAQVDRKARCARGVIALSERDMAGRVAYRGICGNMLTTKKASHYIYLNASVAVYSRFASSPAQENAIRRFCGEPGLRVMHRNEEENLVDLLLHHMCKSRMGHSYRNRPRGEVNINLDLL